VQISFFATFFFTDPKWFTDLAYLSDIVDRLNTLNLSLQGPNSNLLTMSNKIVEVCEEIGAI